MKVTSLVSALTIAVGAAQAVAVPEDATNNIMARDGPGDWNWCDLPQFKWDERCRGHGGRDCRGNLECWCRDWRNRGDDRCRPHGGGFCSPRDWACCRREEWRGHWDPNCRNGGGGGGHDGPGRWDCDDRRDVTFAQCCAVNWRSDRSCRERNCRGDPREFGCRPRFGPGGPRA